MLSLIGFLMIVVIVYLLLKGKMSPIVVLIAVPSIAALVVGTPIADLSEYIKSGISTVSNNSVLFIFSIIFFAVMGDVGVFDLMVERLVRIAGNNVVLITVFTAVIAIIAHLSGATATTVLITIPAMYPIYKRFGISSKTLLTITAGSMGVMNLLPWGGPVARAASVLSMDATDLWLKLIPVQILGILLSIGLAVFLGIKEKAQGAGSIIELDVDSHDYKTKDLSERHKKLMPFNILLIIGVLAILVMDILPSYYVFMIGLVIALIVNFPGQKAQNTKFKDHAGSALQISATMLAAGVMVGIMDGTGMIESIAQTMVSIIPETLGKFTHLIFGALALPMGMFIGTDAYFFGLLPPIVEVGRVFGIEGTNVAITMLVGKNVSLLISPLVPATHLALGLVEDISLGGYIKFAFKYLYIMSLIMLIGAVILGVISL